MTRTITRAALADLRGLLVRAAAHRAALDEIHAGVARLVGDPEPDWGHSADAVYSDLGLDAEALLKRLGVTVRR